MNTLKDMKIWRTFKNFFSRPVPCAILALLVWLLIVNIIALGLMLAEDYLGDTARYIEDISQLVLMSLYVLWLKKKMGNGFEIGMRFDNLGKGLALGGAAAVIVVYNAWESIQVFCNLPVELSEGAFCRALLDQILCGMVPGVTEEYMCRVILMGIIMHLAMGKKHRLVLAVGVSSSLFGALHLINIISGASVVHTLFQVLYATAIGLLFAAIYARTRNIIATMIYHSLIDMAGSCYANFYPDLSSGSLDFVREIPLSEAAVSVAVVVMCLTVGLYLLRPSKHHEIEAHWGSLRNAAQEPAEEPAV